MKLVIIAILALTACGLPAAAQQHQPAGPQSEPKPIRIDADRLDLYDGEQRAVLTGNVTIVSKSGAAAGDRAVLDLASHRLTLTGNVSLGEPPDVTRIECVVYDLHTGAADVGTTTIRCAAPTTLRCAAPSSPHGAARRAARAPEPAAAPARFCLPVNTRQAWLGGH